MNLTTTSTDIHNSCNATDNNSSTTVCEDEILTNGTTPEPNAGDGYIVDGSNYFTPFLIALIIATIIFNGSIVVVISCEKRLHKPANAYILSNACNDFLIAVVPLVGITQNTLSAEWKLGDVFCYMVAMLDAVCASAALTHVFLMAYDRYLAIMRPLDYSKPNRKMVIGIHIALAYTVPFTVWTPPLALYSPKDAFCFIIPPPNYEIAQLFILYFCYISGVAYLYVSCMRGLWSQYFKVRPQKVAPGPDKPGELRIATSSLKVCVEPSITTISVTDENDSQITFVDVSMSSSHPSDKLAPIERSSRANPSVNVVDRSKQSNKRRSDLVRSLRNVGIYGGVWLTMVLPYVVATILCDIFDADRCGSYMAFQVAACIPYYHSIAHPVLYILTQREFRAPAKQFALKLCRRLNG